MRRTAPRLWDVNYFALATNLAVILLARRRIGSASRVRILDAGCGDRPFESLFQDVFYVGSDIDQASAADVIADNAALPFRSGVFDLVIASETLEHTAQLFAAANELERVCRPGGYVFVSVPFVHPLHHSPHDFYRLTEFSLRSIFGGCELVALESSNSIFTTWLIALEYAVVYLVSPVSVLRRVVVPPVALLFNVVVWLIELFVAAIAIVVARSPLGRLMNRRIRHPRGLRGALNSMPCGYAALFRRRATAAAVALDVRVDGEGT